MKGIMTIDGQIFVTWVALRSRLAGFYWSHASHENSTQNVNNFCFSSECFLFFISC